MNYFDVLFAKKLADGNDVKIKTLDEIPDSYPNLSEEDKEQTREAVSNV